MKYKTIHGQYKTKGALGKTWKVRDEGMLNNEKAYIKRGGTLFMHNMLAKSIAVTKGKPMTSEHRDKISKSHIGKNFSAAHKRHISNSLKKHYKNLNK